MQDKEYRDHYDRPSWSELDKRRSKSKHMHEEKPKKPMSKVQVETAKKQYLEKIDKIFKGKKGTDEHDELLRDLKLNYGKSKFKECLKIYTEKYGFPDDWDICILLLDYKDSNIIIEALKNLLKNLSEQTNIKKSIFASKLRILEMTASDKNLVKFLEKMHRSA
jgi:hypothetical protein